MFRRVRAGKEESIRNNLHDDVGLAPAFEFGPKETLYYLNW